MCIGLLTCISAFLTQIHFITRRQRTLPQTAKCQYPSSLCPILKKIKKLMQIEKNFIINNQKLMLEWDFEKNSELGLDPNLITSGSHKIANWKCVVGHKWSAEVKSRVNGNGCKYCAGQGFTPERSLAECFQEIAKEWDKNRNGDLTPETVTYGQKYMAYWLCPKCGESYKALISNRTSKDKKGCPYCCHNPKVNEINNLAVKRPDLAREWDSEHNKLKANDILPNSNKIYHWICSKGHLYTATAGNRSNGYGCPFCTGQKVCVDNSLATINPELAKEWHPTKNKKTFNEVTSGSNQYAWWICERGHEWRAKINNRNNGKGCKECSKGTQSSFPEQAIYFYLKQIYPTTLNGHKLNNTEIDIYIPELKIAIEYDGYRYHNSDKKLNSDLAKNKLFSLEGLKLIRVRENGCAKMNEENCKILECNYTSDYLFLNDIIITLIEYINILARKTSNIQIDISKDRFKIKTQYIYSLKEKSLLAQNPKLAEEWDYDANFPATPEMYLPGSDEKVGWICSICSLKWNAQIKSRNTGCGCAQCANRYQYSTIEWITKATEKHCGKYDYSKVKYINSKTEVIIICTIHGEFSQKPSEHLSGKGCKFCVGQAFHPLNSLAIFNKGVASEWDYARNGEFTPNNVGKTNSHKFWWKCNFGKAHSYLAYIQQRLNGSECAVCAGRQVVLETSLEFLYPEIAKEWDYIKNEPLTPSEVGKGYDKDVWWSCSNPRHSSYIAKVYNRTKKGTGCKKCYEEKRKLEKKKI